MGQMVNLPQVRKWFDLTCSGKAITSCRVDCTFMVYDSNGPGPVLEQLAMPDDSDVEDGEKKQKQASKFDEI